jgi:hypothetical protein
MRELAIGIGALFAPSTKLFGSLSFGMIVLASFFGAIAAEIAIDGRRHRRRHRRKHRYYLEYF